MSLLNDLIKTEYFNNSIALLHVVSGLSTLVDAQTFRCSLAQSGSITVSSCLFLQEPTILKSPAFTLNQQNTVRQQNTNISTLQNKCFNGIVREVGGERGGEPRPVKMDIMLIVNDTPSFVILLILI